MRIKQSDLEAVANRINHITGNSTDSYIEVDDKFNAVVGNFHISYAYGGAALHQMMSEEGSIRNVFGGHSPKRELYNQMQAYCNGLIDAKGE